MSGDFFVCASGKSGFWPQQKAEGPTGLPVGPSAFCCGQKPDLPEAQTKKSPLIRRWRGKWRDGQTFLPAAANKRRLATQEVPKNQNVIPAKAGIQEIH